jgi:hypothetical protein
MFGCRKMRAGLMVVRERAHGLNRGGRNGGGDDWWWAGVARMAGKVFGITCKFQKEEEKVKSKIIKIIKINKYINIYK